MALTTDEMAELASLKAAQTRLLSGGEIAKVSSGGRSIEYRASNLDKIEQLIGALERKGRTRRAGAIGFRL